MNPNHISHIMHKVGIKVITFIIPGSLHDENEWTSAYKSIYILWSGQMLDCVSCLNVKILQLVGIMGISVHSFELNILKHRDINIPSPFMQTLIISFFHNFRANSRDL